jgi:hypothetical protein
MPKRMTKIKVGTTDYERYSEGRKYVKGELWKDRGTIDG